MEHKTGLEDYYIIKNNKKLRLDILPEPARQQRQRERRKCSWAAAKSGRYRL